MNFNSGKIKFALLFILLTGFISNYINAKNPSFNPLEIRIDSLSNGLKIIYYVDLSASSVATVMKYRVGSRDETPGQYGYAHFFEHLMFEKTENIQRGEIDKYTEEAGGNLNASTGFDWTTYHFLMPASEAKLPLWVESQRMRKLNVEPISVEVQKNVVLEEMKQRNDNQAYGSMLEIMCSYLFADTYYEWAPIGSAEDIKKAKLDDFKTFYDKFYQPSNAILAIAGNFNINDMKKWVGDYFSPYPKVDIPARTDTIIKNTIKPYREIITDNKAQLPAVFIAFRAPAIKDNDYYAMALLNATISNGKSSRFYKKFVAKEQIATAADVYDLALTNAGAAIYYIIAAQGVNENQIEKMLIEEIREIALNGVTDEELQKAKNVYEADFIRSKLDMLQIANSLADYQAYFGNPFLINTELDKYLAVTREDISRVASKYLYTNNYVTLIYIPAK